MQPDDNLDPQAKQIKKQLVNDTDSISLDQPFPEQLDTPVPPPAPPAPNSSQPPPQSVSEEGSGQSGSSDDSDKVEQDKKDDKPKKDDNSGVDSTAMGYNMADLIQAPVKPPEPVKNDDPKETSNSKVKFLIAMGIILFILGLLLMFLFNALLGIAVMILGAIGVVISVFAPVK